MIPCGSKHRALPRRLARRPQIDARSANHRRARKAIVVFDWTAPIAVDKSRPLGSSVARNSSKSQSEPKIDSTPANEKAHRKVRALTPAISATAARPGGSPSPALSQKSRALPQSGESGNIPDVEAPPQFTADLLDIDKPLRARRRRIRHRRSPSRGTCRLYCRERQWRRLRLPPPGRRRLP